MLVSQRLGVELYRGTLHPKAWKLGDPLEGGQEKAAWGREKAGMEELWVDYKVHTQPEQMLDGIETFEMVDERMDGTLEKIGR